MKKLIKIFLVAIIFVCIFTACSEKTSPTPSPDIGEMSPTPVLSPSASPQPPSPSPTGDELTQGNENTLSIVDGITTYTGYDEGGKTVLEGRAVLPRTENPAYEVYYAELKESFYEKCEQLSEQAKTVPGVLDNPYKIETDYEIECNSGNLLSIKRMESIFTGGLHNETTVYCDNFRADTGEPYQLDDFFNCDREVYTERLLAEVREFLKGHESELYDNAMRLAEELFPYEDFCITEGGIVLFYQELALAPFSLGTIRIEILWKEIEDIWKKPF